MTDNYEGMTAYEILKKAYEDIVFREKKDQDKQEALLPVIPLRKADADPERPISLLIKAYTKTDKGA